jgi:hypothetical protein
MAPPLAALFRISSAAGPTRSPAAQSEQSGAGQSSMVCLAIRFLSEGPLIIKRSFCIRRTRLDRQRI